MGLERSRAAVIQAPSGAGVVQRVWSGPAQPDEMVRWTISSDERAEHERGAGRKLRRYDTSTIRCGC